LTNAFGRDFVFFYYSSGSGLLSVTSVVQPTRDSWSVTPATVKKKKKLQNEHQSHRPNAKNTLQGTTGQDLKIHISSSPWKVFLAFGRGLWRTFLKVFFLLLLELLTSCPLQVEQLKLLIVIQTHLNNKKTQNHAQRRLLNKANIV
jgi:hypothetical protein